VNLEMLAYRVVLATFREQALQVLRVYLACQETWAIEALMDWMEGTVDQVNVVRIAVFALQL